MSSFMMEPSNQSLYALFSNSARFSVPRFQRDYAWGLGEWEDLWSDIETLVDEEFHYMGYIVLQRRSQHHFEIIDGQQRLITLSVLVSGALHNLQELIDQGDDATSNRQRLEELQRSFIGFRDPVSLQIHNKLNLNRNNEQYYRTICTELNAPVRRGLTATNKLLRECFEFFAKKFVGLSGVEIARKVTEIADGLLFTKIVVQDDLNAYKVFETLNARGVQLSIPDLIKNYIFSVVTRNRELGDEALDDLDGRWSEVLEQLGEANFTEFVRYHHNIQAPLTTKRNLFKAIRQTLDSPEKAYQYLASLTHYAAIYGALLSPFDEFWHQQGFAGEQLKDLQHYLEGFRLFRIRQPFGVLMVAYRKMSAHEFLKLMRYLFVLSVRYNIVGKGSPSVQEHANNKIAVRIFSGEYTRASHILNSQEFQRLYPRDESFENEFAYLSMPTRRSSKAVRFLLAGIESYLGNPCEYEQCTLEHVCPYNPDETWFKSFGEGINDVKDRLGNVVLLNRDNLQQASFAEKRTFYEKTPFKLARQVATYNEWNLATVTKYQAWLAQQAVQTWRI